MVYRTRPRASKSTEAQQAAGTLRPSVGNKDALMAMTPEKAIAQGMLFAGTPDSVYKQMMNLYDFVGGYGHLVMMGRSGFMTHAETEKSLQLFAREVLPRLQAIAPVQAGFDQP